RGLPLRPARSDEALRAGEGLLVGVERLLSRTQLRRHVLQVDADACPGRRAAAHRIDQNVGGLEMLHHFWMTLLPALEARERIFLPLGAADLDHRKPALGRLHAWRLVRLLPIVWRPGRVALALLLEQL